MAPHRWRPLLLLATLATVSTTTLAHPYPRDDLHAVGFDYLMARDCVSYCGSENQYCCGSGETCFTTSNIAGCSAANGAGHGAYITTWTEMKTFTSTVTTSWAALITPGSSSSDGDCVPSDDTEEACGSVCCAAWQYCAYKGQCYSRDGVSVPVSTYTTDGQLTTRFSQAYRVTSTTSAVATGTTAADADTGGSDNGNNSGNLSAGAIAGIVIGSIAGVALLLLLCFCCIVRGLWALLCGGRGDRDSDDRSRRNSRSSGMATEARYRRGGSAHSRRPTHRTWYGAPVASPSGRRGSSSAATERKKGENKLLLALTAIASTLAALLFLRRNSNKKNNQSTSSEKTRSTTTATTQSRSRQPSRSRAYTDSWSGSDSDGTLSTEPSNYTRRTRDTRGTRYTQASRRPRDRDY